MQTPTPTRLRQPQPPLRQQLQPRLPRQRRPPLRQQLQPRLPNSHSHLYANSHSYLYANSDGHGYAGTPTPTATPTPTPTPAYNAQIRPPINADGTSIFNANRGVIPVKFTLTQDGSPTCALPPATIALTRTAGGNIGPINESVYVMSADNGSNFRIDGCQYIYNLSSSALGTGTYRVDIIINGATVGSATFKLK